MPFHAPALLLKYDWPRKRARDWWSGFYRALRGRTFVANRMGFRLLLDTDNIVDKYVLAFGQYEKAQQDLLFGTAKAISAERRVFVDVGAHWGVYALAAQASKLFARVIAIEADPRSAAQLRANLFLNDLTDSIEAVEAVASNEPGEARFSLAAAKSRVVSRVASLDERASDIRIVRAVRLDDLESMKGGLVVAKIDVEGYERAVIEGMQNLLTQNRGLLQVEVFAGALPAFDVAMTVIGYRKFAEIGNDRFYRND